MKVKHKKKAQAEAKEEAGITATDWKLLGISKAGASVEWDLYYFLATGVEVGKRDLEESEKGDFKDTVIISPSELFTLLTEGKVQEGRTAAYLWAWLAENKYITSIMNH